MNWELKWDHTCLKQSLCMIYLQRVFSYLSFGTLSGSGNFPILIPFSSLVITFQGIDWIILQLIAVSVVLGAKLITEKKESIKNHSKKALNNPENLNKKLNT